MVRSVTTFDPDWSDDDLEAALAFVDDEADRCPGCGHHRDESMAHGMDQAYDAEPIVCHACAVTERAQAAAANENRERFGVFWRTWKRRA